MKKTTLKIWLENDWVPVMPETDSRVVHMGETGKSLELWAQEHSEVFDNHTTEFTAFKNTMGQPGGIATLNESGQIPSTQLPSYVDDIIEGYIVKLADGTIFVPYTPPVNPSVPPTGEDYGDAISTGERGKIYLDTVTGLSYRWSGSEFVVISSPVELGTGVGQAYPGNLGQANADAIATIKADYIKSTDYATEQKVGLVRADKNYGIVISNGLLLLSPADINNINNRTHLKPIDAGNLDCAIKVGITTNRLELSEDSTDESGNAVEGDKTKACKWLGALKKNTDTFVSNNNGDVSVYCVDQNGNQVMRKAQGGVMPDTIVIRLGENIQVPTHNTSYFAINKGQADNSYVAKNTVSSNGLYGKMGMAEYFYELSQWGAGGGENTIARRTSKGGLRVFLDETNANPEEMATPRGYVDGRTLQYENVVYCDLEDVDDSDYTYDEVYFRFCTKNKLTITDTAALAKALYDNGFTSEDKAAIVHHNEGAEGGYSMLRPILLYSTDGNTFTLITKGGASHTVTMSEMYLVSTKRF